MPGAFFLSRNKEATEVCSLGLIKTVLASPLSEPGIPLDHFSISNLGDSGALRSSGARWGGHSRIQDEVEIEDTIAVMQLVCFAPVMTGAPVEASPVWAEVAVNCSPPKVKVV